MDKELTKYVIIALLSAVIGGAGATTVTKADGRGSLRADESWARRVDIRLSEIQRDLRSLQVEIQEIRQDRRDGNTE